MNILPQLTQWFAQEPFLCFSIVACICATIYGLFTLASQGSGGDFNLFFGDGDGDGGGDGGGD